MEVFLETLKILAFCIPATVFFALSVKSPLKAAVFSGALGGGGYVMYVLLDRVMSDTAAVFFATLAACLLAELAARLLKTPATVLSIPAIIPLVPGLSLYKTLLEFGAGDNSGGAAMLIQTFMVAGSMSLAVTLSTLLAKLIFRRKTVK